MTSILIDLRIDAPTGDAGVEGLLIAKASRIRTSGEVVTVPSPIVKSLAAGVVNDVVVPASDSTWYWTLQLYVGTSEMVASRTVAVPAGPAIAWADLVDVDPATYEPLDPAVPGVAELLDIVAILGTTAQQAVTTANGASATAAAAAAVVPRNPLVVGDNLTFQLADGTPVNAGSVRGPQGDRGTDAVGVPWNVNLGTEDLNTVVAVGEYRQNVNANATLARNYPLASHTGILEVFHLINTSNLMQRFTVTGGTQNMRMVYQRRAVNGVFDPWRAVSTQRVDQTAGRAIYTWDDLNSREQLIYGDTGIRDITSLTPVAGIITSLGFARLSRYGQVVEVALSSLTKTAGSVTFAGILPSGFRPTGANATAVGYDSGGNLPSVTAVTNGDFLIRSSGPVNNGGVTLQFRTAEAWPTTLPGAAVGTIPNL